MRVFMRLPKVSLILNDFQNFLTRNVDVSGLRAVIAIRDRTEDAVAEATTETNGACIEEATATWATDLETVGSDISSCADVHVDPIVRLTESFHQYIQEQNRVAFDIQNMVLNVFTTVNPLTSADQITPTVEVRMDELYEEFSANVQPTIVERLAAIANLRVTVPQEVHSCVDAGIVR